LLREAGFAPVEMLADAASPYVFRRSLDADAILGWLYSSSYASQYVLGDLREPFEADLRQKLLEYAPDGRFEEEWAVGAFFAWKGRQ